MKNRLDKYILDKTEELVFITIDESEDLDLMGYVPPKEGIKLPIKSNGQVNQGQESPGGAQYDVND